jgi:hypothetical protein
MADLGRDLALEASELSCRLKNTRPPGLEGHAARGDVGNRAGIEPAEDAIVARRELTPRLDVVPMQRLQLARLRPNGLDAGEVGSDAGGVRDDLTANLRFVDELGGENSLDGLRRFGFDGGPIVGPLDIERQVCVKGPVMRVARNEAPGEGDEQRRNGVRWEQSTGHRLQGT